MGGGLGGGDGGGAGGGGATVSEALPVAMEGAVAAESALTLRALERAAGDIAAREAAPLDAEATSVEYVPGGASGRSTMSTVVVIETEADTTVVVTVTPELGSLTLTPGKTVAK